MRELEALPSEKEIHRRTEAGIGLTSPELATLMAHVKLALKDDLDAHCARAKAAGLTTKSGLIVGMGERVAL